jgi:hypothetical protein
MKAFAMMIVLVALVPVANAEQGDAEDRALTEQMMREAQTPQTPQTAQAPSNTAYGDSEKTSVQAGPSASKEKIDVKNGQ